MSIFISLISALIGFLAAGLLGALAAFLLTSIIYRYVRLGAGAVNPFDYKHREKVFLETAFTLMGRLAKSDGNVSKVELDFTRHLVSHMSYKSEHRQWAIRCFKVGTKAGFDVTGKLKEFGRVCGTTRHLSSILLVYLIDMVYADGVFCAREKSLLQRIAQGLGWSPGEYHHWLGMLHKQQLVDKPNLDESTRVNACYGALGLNWHATNSEIEEAHHALLKQLDLATLRNEGLPEDLCYAVQRQINWIDFSYQVLQNCESAQ